MPPTEHLYVQLDAAEAELAAIKTEGETLTTTINDLVKAFAAKHKCDPNYALNYVSDGLSDLVNDAEGPAFRRKSRLADEISNIEEADLRRSAPMVL